MDVAVAQRHVRASWVNLRMVLGLLIFCSSLIAGQRILEGAQTTVPIWSTTRDLPQSHVLGPGDLDLVEAHLPTSVLTRYVQGERDLEGAILTRAVAAGELVASDWVSTTGAVDASRSMTIPVAPEHAVGGDLKPGDRIDVYATFEPGDLRAKTSLLLRGAEVLEVVTTGGLALGDEAMAGVTVALSPEDSARVAFAVRTAEIDIVRVVGAVGTGGTQSVGADDFQ